MTAEQEQQEEGEVVGAAASSPPRRPPPFLEVACKSSGKIWRFAAGTEAGYALCLINRKLDFGLPQALYIEAVKEGEEPVSFGPNAVLVDYGQGWSLQTTIAEDHREVKRVRTDPVHYATNAANPRPTEKIIRKPSSNITLQYIGRILLAFVFMFLLGGILTLFLENLPFLISFISPPTS